MRFRFGLTKVGVESEFEGGNLGIRNGYRCFFSLSVFEGTLSELRIFRN